MVWLSSTVVCIDYSGGGTSTLAIFGHECAFDEQAPRSHVMRPLESLANVSYGTMFKFTVLERTVALL
jgi:hypothetical protein